VASSVISVRGLSLSSDFIAAHPSNVSAVEDRVPPGPYKSLKVLKFHTFKYKALKSP